MRSVCCCNNWQPSMLLYDQWVNNLRKHAFVAKSLYLISTEPYEVLQNFFRVLTQCWRGSPDAGFGRGVFHRSVDKLHAPTS